MTTLVEIIQADRDASAEFGLQYLCWSGRFAVEVANGKHDDLAAVQAFARHRITSASEAIERAATIADMHDARGDIGNAIRNLSPTPELPDFNRDCVPQEE